MVRREPEWTLGHPGKPGHPTSDDRSKGVLIANGSRGISTEFKWPDPERPTRLDIGIRVMGYSHRQAFPGRYVWVFRGVVYSTAEDLTPEELRALVLEAENKVRARIARAVALDQQVRAWTIRRTSASPSLTTSRCSSGDVTRANASSAAPIVTWSSTTSSRCRWAGPTLPATSSSSARPATGPRAGASSSAPQYVSD
jgi:hypothetical protein